MRAIIFPGQGSQKKGMGKDLFKDHADWLAVADEILGYSLEGLCMDKGGRLIRTEFTQPALYTVNAMAYQSMINNGGLQPDLLAGHSLGEYNALLAANVFDFETGLRLVQKRGELMSQAAAGSMAAVIGLSEQVVMATLQDNQLGSIDIANLNTPKQVVISGPKGDIIKARTIFERNKRLRIYLPLKVRGAFHSRYMLDSQVLFGEFMQRFVLSAPNIPVISNRYARPYEAGQLNRTLLEQITSQVKWTETVRYMRGSGVDDFLEIGPGNVLSNMVKTIKSEDKSLVLNSKPVLLNELFVAELTVA